MSDLTIFINELKDLLGDLSKIVDEVENDGKTLDQSMVDRMSNTVSSIDDKIISIKKGLRETIVDRIGQSQSSGPEEDFELDAIEREDGLEIIPSKSEKNNG